MQEVNWKDPKILIGIFAGVAAVGMTLYNCRGSGPGVPVGKTELTHDAMRDVAGRTLMALVAGANPKSLSELPSHEGAAPRNTDAWGRELTFSISGENKKQKKATIVSAGADGTPGTADDITCVVQYEYVAGPGYDHYVTGAIEVTGGQ